MGKRHQYQSLVRWTGNTGSGTTGYPSYERSYTISINGKPDIPGSSDPAFRGNPSKHNPEDLLLSSLAACHLLWYLHLCSEAGVIVTEYTDNATGIMAETADGGGRFIEVILHPAVTVQNASMIEKAGTLHQRAHELCFIANSVNFPVRHQPTIISL